MGPLFGEFSSGRSSAPLNRVLEFGAAACAGARDLCHVLARAACCLRLDGWPVHDERIYPLSSPLAMQAIRPVLPLRLWR